MDTCQLLSLANANADTFNNWIPNFEIFQPGFEFIADTIPWDVLNWDYVDWTNFDVRSVRWDDNNNKWLDTTWTELIGIDNVNDLVSESSVCTFLQQSVGMSESLFGLDNGGCTCSSDDGLSIGCNFNDVCVRQELAGSSSNNNNVEASSSSICGNVEFDLNFEVLAGVNNTICIDYTTTDGATTVTPPRTCFTYTIPFADTSVGPFSCSATYGGDENVCECNIDENFCLRVDCSEFGGSSAVVDSCQYVGLDKAENAQPFLLKIGGPEEGSLLGDGDVDLTVQGPGGSADPTSSELSSGSVDNSAASNPMGSRSFAYGLFISFIASPLLFMMQ